jgi:hypothetical protein
MRISLLMTLTLIAWSTLANSQSHISPDIYGTFSSYTYIEESGDIVGIELVVLPGFKHPEVVFQCAEGAPGETVLSAANVADDKLTFDIPQDNMCRGHYIATLTKSGLRLTGDHLDKPELLPRRKSYWAPYPAAKQVAR